MTLFTTRQKNSFSKTSSTTSNSSRKAKKYRDLSKASLNLPGMIEAQENYQLLTRSMSPTET
jgi:hypothetical protein